MSDVVFRADSICRAYGDRRILNSATLCGRSGSVSVLFGRNGSGKSTLFRIAAGLQRADQGVIHFRGATLERPRLHRLAAMGLFYLPERGLLVRNITVREQFAALARRFGSSTAADVPEGLQVEELLDRMPDSLSGGERRRAEFALAVQRRPLVFIADEPFMGIAPVDIEVLSAALRSLAGAGCAVIVSGHEVAGLLDVADDVTWLTAGTTHGLGTSASARANWQFRREYLGA
jgi:lipopolysaccharide export system ATP-binding protein